MSRFDRTHDGDLSPYYLKLYKQVAALPAMLDIQERMLKDLREASVRRVKYGKANYGDRVEVIANIMFGISSQKVSFIATGDDPAVRLEDSHLVDEEELLDIYSDNVGREGKPIRPHGLIKEDTVKYGAEPRGKNKFTPWMLTRLFSLDEYTSAKARAQHRLAQEILKQLAQNESFVEFSEGVSMQAIVNALKQFSHLPPDTLHRAIDLMYVETTMER